MSQHSVINAAAGSDTVIPALRRASAATGVDFGFLLEQARTESSLNPRAQAATSSARGLFQFIESTWLDVVDRHGAKYGLDSQAAAIRRDAGGRPVVQDPDQRAAILRLRDDPYLSGVMAGELARENAAALQEQLGRPAKPGELYMAHFLGANGAARFLDGLQRNPDLNASHVLPGAARANAGVFFKSGHALSLHQVYARFDDKFNAASQVAVTTPQAAAAVPAGASVTARAAANIDPALASLAAHATKLAALSTLQLGNDSAAAPAAALAAAPATAAMPAVANPLGAALPLPARTPLPPTADTPLRLATAGQASLFSLRVLQSLTLPGEHNAQQQRRWSV